MRLSLYSFSWTYLEESERSGMAVLEVKIPTGYFVLQTRLDEYVLSGLVPTLRRAKYYHDKVVIYFDYVSDLIYTLSRDTCKFNQSRIAYIELLTLN